MEPALALLDACGFDAVHQGQQLTLEAEQLRARLAESPVIVGECPHLFEVIGRGSDVLRPALAAIGEDGAGVEFSVRAVAGGFPAAATERVEGAWEEGLTAEEGLQQGRDLIVELAELQAERTEVVRHGRDLVGEGRWCLYVIIPIYLQKSRVAGKKSGRRQKRWNPPCGRRGHRPRRG